MAVHNFHVSFYDEGGLFMQYMFEVNFPEGLDISFWKRDNAKVFDTFEAVLTPRTGWIIKRIVDMVEQGHFPSIALERKSPETWRKHRIASVDFSVSPEDLLTFLGICKIGMFVESDPSFRRSFFEEVVECSQSG